MVGQEVTITATVGWGTPGGPIPTGSVSFTALRHGDSGCTSVPLSSSLMAVCMTSTLAVGTDAIVADLFRRRQLPPPSSGMLSQIVNPLPVAVQFVPVTPCRLYDTRPSHGGSGAIQGGTAQAFNLLRLAPAWNLAPVQASIFLRPTVYSLNITVIPHGTWAISRCGPQVRTSPEFRP